MKCEFSTRELDLMIAWSWKYYRSEVERYKRTIGNSLASEDAVVALIKTAAGELATSRAMYDRLVSLRNKAVEENPHGTS
jgi:hypothetical protein